MSGAATAERTAEVRRDHLAYAPEHGLYAVYRGAGGVALAAVLAVIGCAGAFVPWPSFELRPIASVLAAVWWLVWWSAVFVIYAKGIYRLTTDVLASVEMGVTHGLRMGGRASTAVVLVLVSLGAEILLFLNSEGADHWSRNSLFQTLMERSSVLIVILGLLVPASMCIPVVVELRKLAYTTSGRFQGLADISVLFGVVAFAGVYAGLIDPFVGGAVGLAFVCIVLLLLAWLAAGLRRRIAAILGAIARIEGEEAGRGEVAKVFSGEAGAGRETE